MANAFASSNLFTVCCLAPNQQTQVWDIFGHTTHTHTNSGTENDPRRHANLVAVYSHPVVFSLMVVSKTKNSSSSSGERETNRRLMPGFSPALLQASTKYDKRLACGIPQKYKRARQKFVHLADCDQITTHFFNEITQLGQVCFLTVSQFKMLIALWVFTLKSVLCVWLIERTRRICCCHLHVNGPGRRTRIPRQNVPFSTFFQCCICPTAKRCFLSFSHQKRKTIFFWTHLRWKNKFLLVILSKIVAIQLFPVLKRRSSSTCWQSTILLHTTAQEHDKNVDWWFIWELVTFAQKWVMAPAPVKHVIAFYCRCK